MAEVDVSLHDSLTLPCILESLDTHAREDGRIDIDCSVTLNRQLSQLAHDHNDIPPPAYSPTPPSLHHNTALAPPPLNIVIQIVGSRGDVQPFIALGCELQKSHGHRVRLATHDAFRDLVLSAGLEFYPIGGNPTELMAYMVKNPGIIPSVASIKAGDVCSKRRILAEVLEGCWRACIEPDPQTHRPFVADAIIANPPSFGHIHCAQALGIPLHIMFTMPWSSTRAFAHPLANLRRSSDGNLKTINLMSYGVIEWMTWRGIGDLVNLWRTRTLGLEAIPEFEGPGLLEKLAVPHTYCWSPALIPKPLDWPKHIDICGFFFREPMLYEPSQELLAFLEAGTVPIYIGFGSIVVEDPERLTEIVLAAVEQAGVRVVISPGWSNLGRGHQSDDKTFYIDEYPHEWLFPRVAAVVHHGGAGTTACGLLNSVPTVVVPFFGDQPFWGEMVATAGAGPSPIPYRSLNAEKLAQAIKFSQQADCKAAVSKIADQMRQESGVKSAVASFHSHLPSDVRCDVLPDEVAAWRYKSRNRNLKLSRTAAAVLSHEAIIRPGDLKHFRPRSFEISPQRRDPVSAIISAALHTAGTTAEAASMTFSRPYQAYKLTRAGGSSTTTERPQSLQPVSVCTLRLTSNQPDTTHHMEDFPSEKAASSAENLCLDRSASQNETKGNSRPEAEHSAKILSNAAVAGRVMVVCTKSLGILMLAPAKCCIVDIPLAAIEGMQALPRLCGVDGYKHQEVTDWKSGFSVGGRSFAYAMQEGFTDIFSKTYAGKRDNGALGVAKGLGQGLVSLSMKTGAGGMGLFIYPFLGTWKTIHTATHTQARDAIERAKRAELRWSKDHGHPTGANDFHVLRTFLGLVQRQENRLKAWLVPFSRK